jgi:alkylation response protein AidB-like acyl-CoA dehydrogenase
LGCIVVENGVPRVDGNCVPETRQCLLQLSQCEILDTWHTTGLRGTGSNDVVVHDEFVEEERSFSFQDPELIKRAGPLYAFPFMFVAKGSAPALGIARHAIDVMIESAAGKPARRYTVGEGIEAPKVLRDDVYVQEAVGRAETPSPQHARIFSTLWAIYGRPWSRADSRPTSSLHYSPAPIRMSSASAWMWCSSSTRRQAARQSIRRDHSIAACATF